MFGLFKGRFERALSRKSKAQNRIKSIVEDAREAEAEANQNLSELSALEAEIREERKVNRSIKGMARNILEGVGELE